MWVKAPDNSIINLNDLRHFYLEDGYIVFQYKHKEDQEILDFNDKEEAEEYFQALKVFMVKKNELFIHETLKNNK